MPRDRRLPLIDGDRCTDGRGNVGSARKCLNRTTREWFIGVKVIEGPDKNTWGQPYQFTPEIDHVGGTSRQECDRCRRPFLSRVRVLTDLGGYTVPRDTHCRTCTGFVGVSRPSTEPESYSGSEWQKVEHHSRPR